MERTLTVHGPIPWLADEDSIFINPLGSAAGVYLLTFENETGFVVYAAGVTRRRFSQRFIEHTRAYLDGTYSLLDPVAAARGERIVTWQGLWLGRDASKRLPELFARASVHIAEVERVLSAFRVFVVPLTDEARLGERVEAAVMDSLYDPRNPFTKVPDRGMALRRRRADETPVTLQIECSRSLHGIPKLLTV